MRYQHTGYNRRCHVCNRASNLGFIIRYEPPLDGFYCSEACIAKAREDIEKVKEGRMNEVVKEGGGGG